MSAIASPYLSEKKQGDFFGLAIAVSLLVHLGAYFIYPYLDMNEPGAAASARRVVVEVNTVIRQPVIPEVTPPPPPEIVKPPEVERVLAVDTPDIPNDYLVLAKPEPVIEKVKPVKKVKTTKKVKPVKKVKKVKVVKQIKPVEKVKPVEKAQLAEVVQTVDEVKTTDTTQIAANTSTTTSSSVKNSANGNSDFANEMALQEAASNKKASDNYGKSLYDMVGRHKKYPQLAIRRNWQGEVKVVARFSKGKLIEVVLLDSSGHKILDKEALAMLRKAVARLPVQGRLSGKTFNVTVPVDFRLALQ
ncbi:MAG: hypothetical protein COA90_11480 [Gammaproteobacteria bacterium]|nr:MAG: hypothetical protein COA90_11480 [Gammaproteobacteria bacterium]